MPSVTSTIKRKIEDKNMDTSQISAFAVFNNLVPGVKAYQDTSESTPASKKRKKIKKKNKTTASAEPLLTNLVPAVKVYQNTSESTPASNGKKNQKKNKTTASDEPSFNNLVPAVKTYQDTSECTPASNGKKNKKKNKTTASAEPSFNNLVPAVKVYQNTSESTSASKRKKNTKKNKTTASAVPPLNNLVPVVKAYQDTSESTPASKRKKNKKKNKTVASAEPPDVLAILSSKPVDDSVQHGKSLFEWLVHPQPVSQFQSKHWEKAPLLVKRGNLFPDYYEWILTSAKLDDILRKNVLKYQENIDITIYENGIRETVSKEMHGRARPATVWDLYSTGHSVRILNPQTYCKPLWRLNASLQEFLGCFVGANVYLTPPDSQGFAPHYDDIEAFILQLEGKKQWKLYKPRTANEELPRFSSKDFGKEENSLGKPIMDVILEPGDLLYFPRGTIHQAKTVDGYHSMHITLSAYQQNSWGDLLKQHFVKALEKLCSTDVSFRKGLPLDYLGFMGIVHSSSKDKTVITKRKEFKENLKQLLLKITEEEVDDAADEMGKKFIWDSLPPYITTKEKEKTVEEDGEFLNTGRVRNRVEIDPDVEVKLLRKNCVRMIHEENAIRLYFSIENSLNYHDSEPQFLEVPQDYQKAVECLITRYPDFTKVENLPMDNNDVVKKIQIVTDLWERGILITKKPLEAGEIDEDCFDFVDDDDELNSDDLEDISIDDDSDDDTSDQDVDEEDSDFNFQSDDEENELFAAFSDSNEQSAEEENKLVDASSNSDVELVLGDEDVDDEEEEFDDIDEEEESDVLDEEDDDMDEDDDSDED